MIIVPDASDPTERDETIQVEVRKVFDGDGFLADAWNPYRGVWVKHVPFRMAFIDAPEIGQPFGRESRDFLNALIAGRSLNLAPVLKGSTAPTFVDPYRRMLCVPFLTQPMEVGRIDYYWNGCSASGSVKRARAVTRNVELEMVVNGWAWVVERYAFDDEDVYFAAQDDARRNRRGLWSNDDPEPPWDFKRGKKRMAKKHGGQGQLL